MEKLTAANLVHQLGLLPKNTSFNYIHSNTPTEIRIVNIVRPEGPISIQRKRSDKGKTWTDARVESISSQMIWRLANAFIPDQPINVDRIFGGSYNTRSALEALLAHTPQFYYCYPGRIESTSSNNKIKKGHKHIIWCPNNPHAPSTLVEAQVDMVVSEVPFTDIVYDSLILPEEMNNPALDIEMKRRHSQIQIALIEIGKHLGFKTWVAQNDKGIVYKDKKIGEMEGVIASLSKEQNFIAPYYSAQRAAHLIDCIWFKNGRLMPAVMEVEHSTGVTSGLTRMKGFQDALREVLPPFPTRYVIVAADEEREKVYREASRPQFRELDARFFPYSAVEEMYVLFKKRKIKGITEEFLDSYMECIVS
ncbi:restriction endonuclease [Paenibacillus xylanexedens]|uniref:Type II restriction enzyme n=1 Tax=Paenibacillus xylanexedens TaxID=528191 RepID=A0ABS4RSC3_PAEXY|nr:restriction endonuclease [Paenibacillus xylanexedens]MBP2245189.1 type II restriction enzyme [Paenibacillus xylanexedens]